LTSHSFRIVASNGLGKYCRRTDAGSIIRVLGMIKTLAELLAAPRTKEAAVLDRYDIQHPTLIGNMYEGLARQLIRKSVFQGLDLRVVDGKLRDASGSLSNQIDCMLVEGAGERIPYTDSYIYPIAQVIAVIEVKKNLYSNDLRDAYSMLRTVTDIGDQGQPLGLARSAFRAISQRDASPSDLPSLPDTLKMIFLCLAKDSLAPIRVVNGFFGFATEQSLRSHLIEFLAKELETATPEHEGRVKGFGPASFPNLILCRESALVKLNGMPYNSPIIDHLSTAPVGYQGGWWPFYASATGMNALLLLEVLWTRLRNRYDLPSAIFGEDLEVEELAPLLFAKPVPQRGWQYVSHLVRQASLISRSSLWEPAIISLEQASLLMYLGEVEEVKVDTDQAFADFAAAARMTKEKFLDELASTKLVFVDDQRRLRFLTYQCATVFLPDGRIAAGENSTGRLARWVTKQS
jgi:hypothetical protein